MTVDPQRLLVDVVQAGKVGMLVAGLSLCCYLLFGSLLVVTGNEPWAYSFLDLTVDFMPNGLLSLLGFATVCLSGGLAFLGQIARADDVDRLIVVLSGALGVGFGISLVRFTLPVVIEYVHVP